MKYSTMLTAVGRGIDFLDNELPDWRTRIDINTLDMALATKCVLGQLFRGFALCDWSEEGSLYTFAERHGFYIPTDYLYPQLTKIWKQAILNP